MTKNRILMKLISFSMILLASNASSGVTWDDLRHGSTWENPHPEWNPADPARENDFLLESLTYGVHGAQKKVAAQLQAHEDHEQATFNRRLKRAEANAAKHPHRYREFNGTDVRGLNVEHHKSSAQNQAEGSEYAMKDETASGTDTGGGAKGWGMDVHGYHKQSESGSTEASGRQHASLANGGTSVSRHSLASGRQQGRTCRKCERFQSLDLFTGQPSGSNTDDCPYADCASCKGTGEEGGWTGPRKCSVCKGTCRGAF